jgi:uncharacterized delta-60 repeat protein
MARQLLLLALVLTLAARAEARGQTLDPFNAGFSNPTQVFAIAVQPDGKILVGGNFGQLGVGCGGQTCPITRLNIARLHPDGSLDLSFNPGTNSTVRGIAVQPDGKILVGGSFTAIGGGTADTPQPYLARLNADGTLDAGFAGGANGAVGDLFVQADGKILVGGGFSSLGLAAAAVPRNGIGRLNSDGTVDAAFDPGASGYARVFAVQTDGRIITRRASGVARLDQAGVPDALDVAVTGTGGTISAVAVQPDGQIVIGGQYALLAGTARNGLGRVTESGVFDPSLDAGLTYPDFPEFAAVYAILLQTDGRIIVGGLFDSMDNGVERISLGRRLANGSLDSFSTSALGGYPPNSVHALALDSDGRVLVGGSFGIANGPLRAGLFRFTNTHAATRTVSVSPGGSSVQWMRGGSSPEVTRVTFESTLDGETWTLLGHGTRIPGGWELSGLTVPGAAVVRARGFVRGSIYESVYLPPDVNLIRNADFSNGTANWGVFATPDLSYIVSSVTAGVFEFHRVTPPPLTANQAVVFQPTGLPVPAGVPVLAEFKLGNSDSARKRLSVLIHDLDFRELAVCTFWLEPNAPLLVYGIAMAPTQTIANVTISFYAASAGSNGGSYQLDDVSLRHVSGGGADTRCVEPAPVTPPGGPDGPSLLLNGDFVSGTLAPGWGTFGQIQTQVSAGVAEFIRPPGTPAGVLQQATGQPMAAGELLTATFDLGNSSAVRKRVLVVLHDLDFTDLTACTFWLQPGQALTPYAMRVFTRRAWADATVSVYIATTGPESWIRLDNVTFGRTPSAVIDGTTCLGSGS